MSIRYCHYCEMYIDLDNEVEHFDTENKKFICQKEEDEFLEKELMRCNKNGNI